MVDAVYAWMKQIVYFLLLVGVIRNLTGREYEKYARLTVGLCLVLMLAAPVLKLLSGEEFRFLWQRNELAQELELLEALPAGQDSKWEDGVIAEYQELIRRQSDELLDGLGMRAEAVELEREGSVVVGFTLRVTPEREAGEDSGGTGAGGGPIREISITDIVVRIGDIDGGNAENNGNAGNSGNTGNAGKTVYELAIKKRLADFYNMDESHIHVIIQ